MSNPQKTAKKISNFFGITNNEKEDISKSVDHKNEELKLDPLYTIFEKHLYDFDDNEENQKEFVDKIAKDYIQFLTTKKVAVPSKWQHLIMEELRDQIKKMMVKKMYGCLSVEEYVVSHKTEIKSKKSTVRKKYNKLF